MSEPAAILNRFAEPWASVVWALTWQSTLLAAVVAVICFALRHSSPGLRYWLWQIVAIKLLVMPLWTVSIPLPSYSAYETSGHEPAESPAVPELTAQVTAQEQEPLIQQDARPLGLEGEGGRRQQAVAAALPAQLTWQSWLLLAWTAAVIWQFGGVLRHRLRLTLLLRQATVPQEKQLTAMVNELASRIGLAQAPPIRMTDGDGSPFTCGLWRPVLVLPRAALGSLDPAQLRPVLLHELAHVKRHDLLWGWIPELARIIYFFHPVAHWVRYRIRLEQELACDQMAMALSGMDAAAYAETLVQVVSHYCQPAAPKAIVSSAVGLSQDSPSRTEPKSAAMTDNTAASARASSEPVTRHHPRKEGPP